MLPSLIKQRLQLVIQSQMRLVTTQQSTVAPSLLSLTSSLSTFCAPFWYRNFDVFIGFALLGKN